jgi:hypothetical protein
MKTFLHNNSFLAIIPKLPIPKTRLNSTALLPSSYSGRLASQSTANSFQVKSKSHCDWRSDSQYVLVSSPIWNSWPDIFITVWQLRSCFCGAPPLTRGRVCLLYMLLALASAVFLGSESLGTRDHILLSQIWDFPFRRLLRLAGSRYSNWGYIALAQTA